MIPRVSGCRALLDRTGEGARLHVICGCFNVSCDYFADDLVAGDDSRIARRELAFYDVQVGAADSAGENAEQNVSGLGIGSWDIFSS